MIMVLRQYNDGKFLVTEYTVDGKVASHIVKTPIENETDGDQLPPLTANPILELKQENEQLKDRLSLAEQAIDELIFGGGL